MLSKEDVDLIPDTSCYAERHIHNIDNLLYLPFLVGAADVSKVKRLRY